MIQEELAGPLGGGGVQHRRGEWGREGWGKEAFQDWRNEMGRVAGSL